MPERYASLLRQHEPALVRTFVDVVYTDRRTDLPALLSYHQLVDYLPDIFDQLAQVLDSAALDSEIAEAVRPLRMHSQARFQQGCLIDEVARELMILRDVLQDFLWREGRRDATAEGDFRELRDALRRTHLFVDEMIAQAVLIYATSLRPQVRTRTSHWPPPRRRRTDFPEH
ncbi:MAG TPA: RsbRD N-terminal domain-containing protein [Pyrinomonadaceae bacterium]|nr:RsbRD N-terminal domain-containing protein [Pyrinomonadaceae bacterium]